MKNVSIALSCAVIALLLAACGSGPIPTAKPPEAESENTLMDEWHKLGEIDHEDINYDRVLVIANTLAQKGPEGLEPFFGIIADPAMTPVKKMLAVISLAPYITDKDVERLMPLTEAKYDAVTRGCAVHLLSHAYAPEAFFRVRDLMHDEDTHVSKVAAMAMLRKGDAEALERLLALWDDPATPDRDRAEIVLGMPNMAAISHLRIFEDAVCREKIERPARTRAIEILGHVGTMSSVPVLKNCLEKESNAALRDMMTAAVEAIEKRDAEGITAVPVQMPAGMDIRFEAQEEPLKDNGAETAEAPDAAETVVAPDVASVEAPDAAAAATPDAAEAAETPAAQEAQQ